MKQLFLVLLLTTGFSWSTTNAQNQSIFVSGLATPIGMETDAGGNIWLAQVGTGNDDGKVSVIAPDGTVNDVVTGLPSFFDAASGELVGAWRSYQLPNNRLLVISGEGTHQYSATLLTYDLTGWSPGDTPLGLLDFEEAFNIDDYVLGQGAQNSNPYSVAWKSSGEMYIVDAGGNGILRRDLATDELSYFATFADLPNPTPVGPPVIDFVPTKLMSDGADGFYVCNLTGFPFLGGMAGVKHVAPDGTVTDFALGQTLLVDLAVDPADGELVALQFAEFQLGPVGFQPGSARAVKLFADGTSKVLAKNFGPASGMTFDAAGNLYVSSIFTGEIIKIEFAPPANDDLCNAMSITVDAPCTGVPNILLEYATAQPNEPIQTCVENSYDTTVVRSAWYSFVAPAGPIFLLAAPDEPSIRNSYSMSIYQVNGDCADLANLQLVACNSPNNGLLSAPSILTTLTEGETYYVRVAGRAFISTPDEVFVGTGCLTISTVLPPANDNVCDAIALELNGGAQIFNNLGATAQLGEFPLSPPPSASPLGIGNDGWALATNFIDNSVWFTFTTPAGGGNVSIDLQGSIGLPGSFNTQLAIYSATDCNDFSSFSLVQASDNSFPPPPSTTLSANSRIDLFCLEGNTTYYVLVDGGASFFFQPIANQGYFSINATAEASVPITANALVEAPVCAGGKGSIFVAAQGGAGNFTYAWNTGDSTQTLAYALPAGSYSLTITDMCGDEGVETFEVPASQFGGLAVDAGADLPGCEGSQVQLNALASGGLPFDTKRMFFQKPVLSASNLLLIHSQLELPAVQDTVSTDQMVQFRDMEFVGDELYAIDLGSFYSVNTSTGEVDLVGALPANVVDLSYVPAQGKLYCMTTESDIYEINPATSATTLVASTGIDDAYQAAIDNSGTGYVIAFDGNLYSVDLATGTPTLTGAFGLNSVFPVRGLEIDPATDKLYATYSTTVAQGSGITWQSISEIDKTTGALGTIYRDLTANILTTAFAFHDRTVEPYQYTWTPAAGLDDATLQNPTFVIDATTQFTVSATDYCSAATDAVTVELLPTAMATLDTVVFIGDTYNGNVITGDTSFVEIYVAANGCDSLLTVNIMAEINATRETWPDGAVSIYPNPVSSILKLNTEGILENEVSIVLRDIYGRNLWQMIRQSNIMDLEVSHLLAGIYLLEIRSNNKVKALRFVKQ